MSKPKRTFLEEYVVAYDYQNEQGFWRNGDPESIFVEVVHGENEKNNHEAARLVFMKKFPTFRVQAVSYV